MPDSSTTDIVRGYLTVLAAADSDSPSADALRKAADKAADPIEKLTLTAKANDAETLDARQVEFVKVASDYATTNNIPGNAFVEMGVPADVLTAAGIDPTQTTTADATAAPTQKTTTRRTTKSRAKTTKSRTTAASTKSRKKPAAKSRKTTTRKKAPAAPAVDVTDEVVIKLDVKDPVKQRMQREIDLLAKSGPSTIKQLVDLTNSSRSTVINDLKTLEEAGRIADAGTRDTDNAGAPPKVYALAGPTVQAANGTS